MSDSVGAEVGIEGAGGGGLAFDADAMASQAAFSSSRLHRYQYGVNVVSRLQDIPSDFLFQLLQFGFVHLVLGIRLLYHRWWRCFFLHNN
jgi:hypothetical protein